MISRSAGLNRNSCVWQAFNHIAYLKVILAISIHREPPRRDSVYSIAADERIVQTFDNFVAQSSNIFKPGSKETGADPACVIQHVALLAKSIPGVTGLEIVGVKTEYAAVVRVPVQIEISVRKEKCGDRLRRNFSGMFGGADWS